MHEDATNNNRDNHQLAATLFRRLRISAKRISADSIIQYGNRDEKLLGINQNVADLLRRSIKLLSVISLPAASSHHAYKLMGIAIRFTQSIRSGFEDEAMMHSAMDEMHKFVDAIQSILVASINAVIPQLHIKLIIETYCREIRGTNQAC
jgi:hypothetical protein